MVERRQGEEYIHILKFPWANRPHNIEKLVETQLRCQNVKVSKPGNLCEIDECAANKTV